jgi:hypothetical protein
MEKLIELGRAEAQNINGGEGPTWNWTGKVLGAIMAFFDSVGNNYTSTPEGQAVQQALLDFH